MGNGFIAPDKDKTAPVTSKSSKGFVAPASDIPASPLETLSQGYSQVPEPSPEELNSVSDYWGKGVNEKNFEWRKMEADYIANHEEINKRPISEQIDYYMKAGDAYQKSGESAMPDWLAKFTNPIGKGIIGGVTKVAKGFNDLADAPVQAALHKTPLLDMDLAHPLAEIAGGTAQTAFNIIPVAVAFTTASTAIKETANATLSKDHAETVSNALDLPFTMGHKVASLIGYQPAEGSTGDELLGVLDLVTAGKAHESGSKFIGKIKSINDLKNISKEAAENQLSADQLKEYQKYVESLKAVNLDDFKNAAIAKNTPESLDIAKKIEDLKQPTVVLNDNGIPRVVPVSEENLAKVKELEAQQGQLAEQSQRTIVEGDDGIPRVVLPSGEIKTQEELNIAHRERSDAQSKQVFNAIQSGTLAVDKLKSTLDYAKAKGFISDQEHALANQKIDAYQKYYESTTDVQLPPETKRNVFDLTWTNENLKAQIGSVEEQLSSDPNNALLLSKKNALEDIHNENQRAIDNHLISGIADQMGAVSPKTQEKVVKNKIVSDNELTVDEKAWMSNPKNMAVVRETVGEGKTHEAVKSEAKKQYWKEQPENIAKVDKMFAEGKDVSDATWDAEMERQYQEHLRGESPKIVSNPPTAEHKDLHDHIKEEHPGLDFNNLADVSNSEKSDSVVKHMLKKGTRILKGGVVEVGSWAKSIGVKGNMLPHYYDVDFGGKKIKFASNEHTAGMKERNLQGRKVAVQLILPTDANLGELVKEGVIDPHNIVNAVDNKGNPLFDEAGNNVKGFQFNGKDKSIFPHILVARELHEDGSIGNKIANLVSSDFSDFTDGKRRGQKLSKAIYSTEPVQKSFEDKKTKGKFDQASATPDYEKQVSDAKAVTVHDEDRGFTAKQEEQAKSSTKEQYVKKQITAQIEDGDFKSGSDLEATSKLLWEKQYDRINAEKELLNNYKISEDDNENKEIVQLLEDKDSSEQEPDVKSYEVLANDAASIEGDIKQTGISKVPELDRTESARLGEIAKLEKLQNKIDKAQKNIEKLKTKVKGALNFQSAKAMKHDVSSAYDQVLQFFIGGGKINSEAIQELYGGPGKAENVKSESKLRSGYLEDKPLKSKTDKAIEGLAHNMWENQKVPGQFDTQDFRAAIEEVINEHTTRSSMAKHLNESFSDKDTRNIDTSEVSNESPASDVVKSPEEIANEEAIKKMRGDEGEPQFSKAKTIVGKEIEKQISETEKELKAAKSAFDAKRVELDKKIVDDQADLFGERKSTEPNAMFDERVSEKERNKVIEPFKVRIEKATEKLADLHKKLQAEEGKEDLTLFQKGKGELSPEAKALREKKISLLKKSIPGINVVDDASIGEDIAGQLDADGKTVRLNPNYNYSDTPIHEFGHAIIDILGGTKNSLIKKGIDQLRNTELWKDTESRYPELSPDMLAKEVLAESIGREGAKIFDTKEAQSKFKNFLDGLFYKIKRALGIEKSVAKDLAGKLLKGEKIAEVKDGSGKVQQAKSKANTDEEKRYELNKDKIAGTKYNVGKTIEHAKNFSSDLFAPVSTVLQRIHPKLKTAIRDFQSDLKIATDKDMSVVKSFLIKAKEMRKMDPRDYSDYDYARKNNNVKRIAELEKKYGIDSKKVHDILNSIDARAEEKGVPVAYRSGDNPVRVKDYKGLMDYVSKELKTDAQSIKEESELREQYLQRAMTDEEKGEFANEILRKRAAKNIEYITPEMDKFYDSSDDALINYVNSMNLRIATRDFAGKGDAEKGFETMSGAMWQKANDLLVKGEITPSQYEEVDRVMKAYFNQEQANKFLTGLKNIGFIDIMGHFGSALTQLSHIGFALYDAGAYKTAKALGEAITGKSEIKKTDLFAEDMMQEFGNQQGTQGAVSKIFKWAGLNLMDKLAKQTIVNAHIDKLRSQAKKLDTMGRYDKKEFMKRLDDFFEPDHVQQIIKDLKSGKMTDDILKLAYNRILDLQPVAKSEVPLKYLENPNGRWLYSLKQYTLKIFDAVRNEAFTKIKSKDPRDKAEGVKRLILLATSLAFVNATTDELRDLMEGKKDMSLSDRILYGYMKVFGVNSYMMGQLKKEGASKVAASLVTPNIPLQLFDDLYKDIFGKGNGEFLKHLPVIGKFIYDNTHPKK